MWTYTCTNNISCKPINVVIIFNIKNRNITLSI